MVHRLAAIALLVWAPSLGAQIALYPDPPRLDAEGPDRLVRIDLDEDGSDELYFQYEGELAPAVAHTPSASGSLTDPELVPGATEGTLYAVADADLDGHLDLVICDDGSGRLAFGDGQGGIDQVLSFSGTLGSCSTIVADFDLDGFPDLLGGSTIRFGLGNRQFSTPLVASGAPYGTVAADLDLDSFLDIPEAGTTTLRICSGNGVGQFIAGPLTTVSATSTSVRVAEILDVDTDPFPDLLVYVGGAPRYYLTQADGTFLLSPTTPPAAAGTTFQVHGDLNADGVRDFAGMPTAGGTLSLLVSDPAGGFFPVQTVATGLPAGEVQLLDLNGDGYDEMIRTEGDLVHVYRNATGLSGADCDGDGLADALEIFEGSAEDCDLDGAPDACELAGGSAADCNANEIPDACDIALGTSIDLDSDGVPDECAEDCDGSGIADSAELASGALPDCDGDGVPDPCAIGSGAAPDCNGNGRPDGCDIVWGASDDPAGNGVPDECEGLQQVLLVPAEYPTISAAIAAAADGDHILVAPGTYLGAIVADARSFRLRSVGGPEVTTLAVASGTALRFSGTLANRIWVEGFTIEGGSAGSGSPTFGDGGGVYGSGVDLTLWGNIIRDNLASSGDGGGVAQQGGRLRLIRNVVEENQARTGAGAALMNCLFEVRDNTFRGNRGTGSGTHLGGGIQTIGSSTGAIDRNLFVDNETDRGGGIHISNTGVSVTRNVIRENSAEDGGGIYSSVAVSIEENEIIDNLALDEGGGVWAGTGSTLVGNLLRGNIAGDEGGGAFLGPATVARRNEFDGNRANSGAGAVASIGATLDGNRVHDNFALGGTSGAGGGGFAILGSASSPATSTSNWIHDNRSGSIGGGVLLAGTARVLFDTLVGNAAPAGSAVAADDAAVATVSGAILWSPAGGPLLATGAGGSLTVEYCIVAGGAAGTGNLAVDPQFVDLAGRDLHILATSPAIGSAPPYPGPSTAEDIDGDPRQICAGADRGADENPAEDPCGFVALAELRCTNVGTVAVLEWSQLSAPDFLEIRRDGQTIATVPALAATYADQPPIPSIHVYEVIPSFGGLSCCAITCTVALPRQVYVDASAVAPGTGTAAAPFVSLSGAIQSPYTIDGCELVVAPGSYPPPIAFLGKEIVVRSTDGPAVTIIEFPGAATSPRLVDFNAGETRASRLEGFTIRGEGGFTAHLGIRVASSSSPEIVGNVIEDCVGGNGGGISIAAGCAPWVVGNVIRGNTADLGGGIYSQSAAAVIRSNWIEGNTADTGGAGLWINATATIENLIVIGNNSFGASGGGGLLGDLSSNVTVIHCVFADNYAGQGGGARSRNTMQLENSIVWDNFGGTAVENDGFVFSVGHCAIQGGWPGVGNLAADPLFSDPGQGDYSLLSSSPCIDAGIYPAGLLASDFNGDPRPVCGSPDMGAIEMPVPAGGCSGVTPFRRGDCNGDGARDVSDPVRLLLVLFAGLPFPDCPGACDADDDGDLDIADAIASLDRLFAGSGSFPFPADECGPDPTPDPVPCTGYPACP